MPTAKKLPSGSWRCQVFSHFEYIPQPDGSIKKKKIQQSFTSDDPSPKGKREAERMAAAWAYNKERKERYNLTLGEAMDEYIKGREGILAVTTLDRYRSLRKNAYPDLINKRTRNIKQSDIQNWCSVYSLTHKPKGVANAHGFLSAVMGVFEPDLRIHTALPTVVPYRGHIPGDAEIKALLDTVKDTEMEKAILLAAFGGLRRGEICALTADDIIGDKVRITKAMVKNRQTKEYEIKDMPKTVSSVRDVDLPHFVIEKMPKEGRLVDYRPEALTVRFIQIMKSLDLEKFRLHDLRHYTASIMHALGVPDQYIMDRGGWKSDTVMKRVYRNTLDDRKAAFTSLVNSHFEEVAGDTVPHEIPHE